ncbi:hypothetical protein V6N11_037753 [Hibiscus sabdariffa]|uniref:Uncharacterized protein n=2 Tax=Hibiscus sabdariffa TaxID=183260 RepID=A0ABR2PEF0_9ROSI
MIATVGSSRFGSKEREGSPRVFKQRPWLTGITTGGGDSSDSGDVIICRLGLYFEESISSILGELKKQKGLIPLAPSNWVT